MKLHDCGCGEIPKVKFVINDTIEYVVICSACRIQTPICASLREAVTLWNQTYSRALPPHVVESA